VLRQVKRRLITCTKLGEDELINLRSVAYRSYVKKISDLRHGAEVESGQRQSFQRLIAVEPSTRQSLAELRLLTGQFFH